MPRQKQPKHTMLKDIRTILRLTQEGLSVRGNSEWHGLSKTSVATYQLRARETGLSRPLAVDQEMMRQRLIDSFFRPEPQLSAWDECIAKAMASLAGARESPFQVRASPRALPTIARQSKPIVRLSQNFHR